MLATVVPPCSTPHCDLLRNVVMVQPIPDDQRNQAWQCRQESKYGMSDREQHDSSRDSKCLPDQERSHITIAIVMHQGFT